MYILNKKEQAVLKIIVKNARNDFFRNNKYIFIEESLDNKITISNESTILNYEDNFEYKVEIDELENIFEDEKIYDVIRALTYNEKSVLYFYYVKEKKMKKLPKLCFPHQKQ